MGTTVVEDRFVTRVEDVRVRPAALGTYLVNGTQALGVDVSGIG